MAYEAGYYSPDFPSIRRPSFTGQYRWDIIEYDHRRCGPRIIVTSSGRRTLDLENHDHEMPFVQGYRLQSFSTNMAVIKLYGVGITFVHVGSTYSTHFICIVPENELHKACCNYLEGEKRSLRTHSYRSGERQYYPRISAEAAFRPSSSPR